MLTNLGLTNLGHRITFNLTLQAGSGCLKSNQGEVTSFCICACFTQPPSDVPGGLFIFDGIARTILLGYTVLLSAFTCSV
jgi:hypothetical protein